MVIAGAGGGVGASLAFNLLLSVPECEVVMADARENMLLSHLWDLEQVVEQRPGATVRAGSTSEIASADVLVVTAAAPLTVNASRMVYLRDNAVILGSVLDRVPDRWPGTVILVTNPVDPLGTWAVRRYGLDRTRLLGYTLNDSLRLRTGIARVLGAAPGRVEAWTLGEHGERTVPLWERVFVDGVLVSLDEVQRAEVASFVDGWYVRHVALDSGRSSTWTSGLGIARMVGACLSADGDELWPASVVLHGEYGLSDVSVSVPVRLGGGGARGVCEWTLSGEELEALHGAAAFVRAAVDELG